MDPSAILDETLRQLGQILLRMASPEWALALEGQPEEIVRQAERALLRVQEARLQLGNAQLAAIRDELVSNEAALVEGRRHVAAALEDLKKVETVLEKVSSFVDAVTRVLSHL